MMAVIREPLLAEAGPSVSPAAGGQGGPPSPRGGSPSPPGSEARGGGRLSAKLWCSKAGPLKTSAAGLGEGKGALCVGSFVLHVGEEEEE
ncbi:hypothetical protein NHX12_007859 [Muraenolepis orangiensis]|uniref:Uncharacterized protein n=1 Tax=Muraenolepis orangiensis TaxID=630683 RepID=A0A9Q0DQV5_9TELE|nr:hypothetical protein NHX12_007859 [Muraenolepis orangiensis]